MINSLLALLLPHKHLVRTLALAWMVVIFLLSAQTSLHIPSMFFQQDKAFHSLLFSVLGIFYSLLVMRYVSRFTFWHVVIVTLMVMAYGGLDEFHQSFVPGRTPDILDLAADTTGGLISALLMKYILNRYAHRKLT